MFCSHGSRSIHSRGTRCPLAVSATVGPWPSIRMVPLLFARM